MAAMNQRLIKTSVSPAAVLLASLLCGEAVLRGQPCHAYLPPAYGGNIVTPLNEQPITLSPHLATRLSELQLVSLLFDTLYRRVGFKVVPHLLRGPAKVSADNKLYTLTLRQSIALHGGGVLTASDVVKSLRATKSGPHGHLLGVVRSISARDAHTIDIALRKSFKGLPQVLAMPACAISITRGNRILGSGPFSLQGRTTRAVSLRAHDKHFAGRPYVDGITFKIYSRTSAQAANYQIGVTQLSFYGTSVFSSGTPRYKAREMTRRGVSVLFLAFGKARAVLSDQRCRRAIASSVDRRRLARLSGGQSRPAAAPVFQKARYRRPRWLYSRRDAARIFKAALIRYGLSVVGNLRLSLLVDATRPEDRIFAGQLVADLYRVGVALRIVQRPAQRYRAELQSGNFDLALVRRTVATGGVAAAWSRMLAAAGDVKAASRCLQRASAAACQGQSKRFLGALPWFPLVHEGMRVHVDTRLGGLTIKPNGVIDYASGFWRRNP
jgi:peptide/nickel transport system substrate-binding protein